MSGGGLLLSILADHWKQVEGLLDERVPAVVAEAARNAASKAFSCRTEGNGFVQYRCDDCGAIHKVCFRCKSRFCPTCGIARAQEAAANAQGRLLNVRHRHLTFSVPAELRPILFADRKLLSVVAKAAVQATLTAVGTRCRRHAPIPGVMATIHTYGRDLSFHVHVHVLCTEGGLRADGVWQPVHIFPAKQYRRLWQYYLLQFLRQALRGNRSAQWVIGRLYTTHPSGFIVNVMGMYRNGRMAAAYCCRYTGRPPLSEKRIIAYDGEAVTIAYRDYRDGKDKAISLPASEFLLRLLQHVWPRYQRDVHYHGLYQPSRRKVNVAAVARASYYGDQVRPVLPLSRRERMLRALAGRELNCPSCGGHLSIEYVQFRRRHHVFQRSESQSRGSTQLPLPV